MKKYSCLFAMFLFATGAVFALDDGGTLATGHKQPQIKKLKSVLNSKIWQPVDSVSYMLMVELIRFIESTPIDTVIEGLQNEIEPGQPLFKRSIYNVFETDQIRGYITDSEVRSNFSDIEKRVHSEYPYESIVVPENYFFGMYSKLPVISYSNKEKLITDSLICLPDSIKLLIEESKTTLFSSTANENGAVVSAFLNNERKKYNDALVDHFRDSVTRSFRGLFLDKQISTLKKSYSDSVSRINTKLLRSYNDSVAVLVNNDLKAILDSLVDYVNRQPNNLSIFDPFNGISVLPLQNDTSWYKWIWLKNTHNDSIGVRVENIGKNSLGILVDETVNLSRISQRKAIDVEEIRSTQNIEQKLHKVNPPKVIIKPWKLEGRAYSGFTQNYINSYWSKGGSSSASTLSTFNYMANYYKGKIKWESSADAKLGLIYYLPEDGSTPLRNWHKNSDNFEINSRFGLSAFKKWYYSAEANFKTQFFLGFKNNNEVNPNSALLSPAYLTFSGGFDFKPNKNFSAFISPLSLKTTYVINPKVDETIFGLEEGQTSRSRMGMGGKVEFSKDIVENVVLRSKNSVFINFGKNNNNEPQLIKIPDFDSESSIDFKVNQFITTQINMHFIYDKDLESKWNDKNGIEQKGTRLQVKEFFTLGISYKI